jgi:hypothetical protein
MIASMGRVVMMGLASGFYAARTMSVARISIVISKHRVGVCRGAG